MRLRDALLTVVLVMVALLLWRHLAADRNHERERA
jgi:hypothetical protein